MKRILAALSAAILLLPPTPAWALRQEASPETGLEEQLRNALLRSPDDLVRTASRLTSTVLGLTPSAVHPELVEGERLGRRAGLEEFSQEARAEILEALQSTGPVTSFTQLFPRLIETARERNVSEAVPQALLAVFRSLPTDSQKRHLTGSLGQAMMMGLHEFTEDFEPDPYPRVLPGRKTIWTVTTSPTIDVDAKRKLANWADRKGVLVDPGGGGINIAVALARRGVQSRPVFFYVGETGKLLVRLIENRGVLVREGDAIEIKADDQTRVTIITSLDKAESLVPKGTPVNEEARLRMVGQLLDPSEGVQAGDIVAISGSLAPGLPDNFYADLGRELVDRGAIVVTDTKGAPAKEVLFSKAAAATIYSQNNLEFAELVGVNPKDRSALIVRAREIINSQPLNQGIREIVITEGAGGAFSVTRDKVLEISAPKVEAVSEVGAGDTSLAERVFRAWQGKGHDAGFVYGVAAGTASVRHPGTGGGLQAEVDHFAEELGLTEETKVTTQQSSTPAGLEEDDSLGDFQSFLQREDVTGGANQQGKAIRGRTLTGIPGQSYDAIVFDQFYLPGLLSDLLRDLNQEGPLTWADVATGPGVAPREAAVKFSNLRPLLVDAVPWKRDQYDPATLEALARRAKEVGVEDFFSTEVPIQEEVPIHIGDAQTVDLAPLIPRGFPLRVITMINALGYNRDPLAIVVNLFNQLEPGGVLLANLYIPMKKGVRDSSGKISREEAYPEGDRLAEFYGRLGRHLKDLGVAEADFRIEDFSKMQPGERNSQGEEGPFKEHAVGILLRRKAGQRLELLQPPLEVEEVTIVNFHVREVTYHVAEYGEDPARVIGLQPDYKGDDWGALVEAIRRKNATHPVVSMTVYETGTDGRNFPIRFWLPNIHENPVNFIAAHWYNSAGRFQFRLSFQDQPVEPNAPRDLAAQSAGKPMVHARLEVKRTGLEEGVRVILRDKLDPLEVRDADDELLSSKLGENTVGVALLPKKAVDAWDLTDDASPRVEIYAHPSVVTWIPYWLPSGWGLARDTQLLEDDPEQANFKLAQAAKAAGEGRTVIVALDKNQREGLELPLGVVLWVDPNTIDGIDSRTVAAFLSQARQLTRLILDLTSGSIRTVTIGNTEYYALDIAA